MIILLTILIWLLIGFISGYIINIVYVKQDYEVWHIVTSSLCGIFALIILIVFSTFEVIEFSRGKISLAINWNKPIIKYKEKGE